MAAVGMCTVAVVGTCTVAVVGACTVAVVGVSTVAVGAIVVGKRVRDVRGEGVGGCTETGMGLYEAGDGIKRLDDVVA